MVIYWVPILFAASNDETGDVVFEFLLWFPWVCKIRKKIDNISPPEIVYEDDDYIPF